MIEKTFGNENLLSIFKNFSVSFRFYLMEKQKFKGFAKEFYHPFHNAIKLKNTIKI